MRNRVRDRPRLPQHEIPSKGSGPDRSDSDFHLHLAQKTVQREIGSGTALGCLSAESRAMRNRTDFGTSFPASRVRAALDVREPAALDVRASMARHPGSDRSLRGQCLSDLSRSERCLGRSIWVGARKGAWVGPILWQGPFEPSRDSWVAQLGPVLSASLKSNSDH
jgi:hypothetical protein